MTVNKELKNLISTIKFNKKLKQSEVADMLGVRDTYLSDMINGRVPYTESLQEKIYEVFSDVLSDKVEVKSYPLFRSISKEDYKSHNNDVRIFENDEQYRKAIESGLKMLPEVEFEFSAGQTALIGNSNMILRYWYLPDCEDCEAIATMRGNSMLPTYPPGCNLVFKRSGFDRMKPNTIAFGNVFGVVVEDEITGEWIGHIKILRRHKDVELSKQFWIARSINPDFDDFDIEIKQVRGLWILKQHVVTNVHA